MTGRAALTIIIWLALFFDPLAIDAFWAALSLAVAVYLAIDLMYWLATLQIPIDPRSLDPPWR